MAAHFRVVRGALRSAFKEARMFVVQKDNGVVPHVLTQILDSCVNGVTLSDPDLEDSPIVYANRAFEAMSGYHQSEIVGRNCRFLQSDDRDQPEIDRLRAAISAGEAVEVTLRNYRKCGEMFHNRLVVQPLFDDRGNIVYYLGIQYDVTEQVQFNREIAALSRQLEMTGA
jgi:PAS domain S-box-containing protein